LIGTDRGNVAQHGFKEVHPNGLPLWGAPEVTIQLLHALEKLHSKGIAHGDVHPGNVLLNDWMEEN
jgi:serine/threonine protein kinase